LGFRDREPIDKVIREEVFHKFGGHCAYCGFQLKKKGFHVDHVIPVAAGGVDDILNFFPACKHCNTLKNSFSLVQFRTMLENGPNKSMTIVLDRFEMIKIIGPVKVVFWYEKQGYVFPYETVLELMKQTSVLNR
jgi:HNH endonuclease